MYCTKCGQRGPDGANFCYHCGARIQTSDDAPPADACLAALAPPPASVSPWGADATGQQMAPGGPRGPVTTPLPHGAPDDPRTSPPVPPAWGYSQAAPAYPQMPPSPPIYPQTPASPPPPPAWGDTLATSRGYVGMAGHGHAPQAAQAPRYAGSWRRFFASGIDSFALGINVTDLAGQRISFGRALGRNLAKLLSSMILSIGYLMAAFSERKQALRDIVAGCLVVSK